MIKKAASTSCKQLFKVRQKEYINELLGFRYLHQRDILKPYEQKYFDDIREVAKTSTKEYYGAFSSLFPFFPGKNQMI